MLSGEARPGRCPVPGCGDPVDATRLMCRHDWNHLPKQLRDHVWATWRSGDGVASGEHQLAVSRAIAACRDARLPAWKRLLRLLPAPRTAWARLSDAACQICERLAEPLCPQAQLPVVQRDGTGMYFRSALRVPGW